MLWVIVALIVIFLAFGAAGVRAALKIGVMILIAGIVLIVGYLAVNKAEEEASKTRISSSEVQVEDLRLALGPNKMTGKIRNRSSRYTLSSVDLQITLRDCIQANCEVVGQESTTLWGLDVPPGQVRAVDEYVYFSKLPPRRGEYQWDYQIKSTKGRQ